MGQGRTAPGDRSIWRSAGQLAISVEDRFRFTLVVCFFALGFFGSGALFFLSDKRATSFNKEAAEVAIKRWHNRTPTLYDDLFGRNPSGEEIAPAILDSNRMIPQHLLPEHLIESEIAHAVQPNGTHVWVINKHPLLEKKQSLVLSETDYPELRIAREAFQFQKWLIVTLLSTLAGGFAALFFFNKFYIFRPLKLLREALLSRKLTDVAKFRESRKSKVIIERLEEKSRFPMEHFDSDEFGQIASILCEQDKKQKNERTSWAKVFNTINEPVVVFGLDLQLKFMNRAMEQFFDALDMTPELNSAMSAERFIETILQTNDEQSDKILRVIRHDHPKINAQTCKIELPDGHRNYRYSIATFVNHGEHYAVVSLAQDQDTGQSQALEDVILEHSTVQMKLVHKIQSLIRSNQPERESMISAACDALVDNMHGLLEESNNLNLLVNTTRVEFNLHQFFADLQIALDGQLSLKNQTEKSCPTFLFGYPTHLRQLLKGLLQAFKEANPALAAQLNASFDSQEKALTLSIHASDAETIVRNPSIALFMTHYNPILALNIHPEISLERNEFSRISIAATAAKQQLNQIDINSSNRELPEKLFLIGDKADKTNLPTDLFQNSSFSPKWISFHEIHLQKFTAERSCAMIVTGPNSNLKSKQTQKAINHLRAQRVPLVLVSQSPRRGETITALRLGFVSYLTLPIEQHEFTKLLILTMNKKLREGSHVTGLLTKHTVRDLIPSLGNVLIGSLSESSNAAGERLLRTLQRMGYSTTVANDVHGLFQLLHKRSFEYIICTSEISTGLKRRIQVSTKGTPCLLFGSNEAAETLKSTEQTTPQTTAHWTPIPDLENEDAIRSAFLQATEDLGARYEGRSTPSEALGDTKENDDNLDRLEQLDAAS